MKADLLIGLPCYIRERGMHQAVFTLQLGFLMLCQMFRVTQQRVEGHSAGKRPELLTKSINALLLVIFTDWGRPLK